MSEFKHSFVCLTLFCYLTIVQSTCILKYPNNIESVPRYEKNIGKYKIQIPYNGNEIELQHGEIINGFCDAYFSSFKCIDENYNRNHYHHYGYNDETNSFIYHSNKSSIRLTCLGGKLLYNGAPLEDAPLECEKMNWSIYATDDTYSWCEKNLNSNTFLLAAKSNGEQYVVAGICYDIEKLLLQTVTYNVTNSQERVMKMLMGISKAGLNSEQSLGDDLWNLKTTKSLEISQYNLQEQLSELGKINSWLNLANYEVSSIVQGDSYKTYFEEYENTLNIIWWRNLRLGNWKSFINTMENYAYNNSFQLYSGISDEVKYPDKRNNERSTVLEIKNGFKNVTIPAYIWTYLKSIDNANRDFIIVGYNSPYAEFFSLDDIIFCPDICSEISWLSEIRSSFRFATAGIMFCCSTDFMQENNRLNGFPLDLLTNANILANKTEIEVASEIEATTETTVKSEIDLITESVLQQNENEIDE